MYEHRAMLSDQDGSQGEIMRRHPPKVSRKKLKAEIESLKGQCLSWQTILSLTSQVYAINTAIIAAGGSAERFQQGGIVPAQSGEVDIIPNIESGNMLSAEQIARLEEVAKVVTHER